MRKRHHNQILRSRTLAQHLSMATRVALIVLVATMSLPPRAAAFTSEQIRFFENKIRPLLSEQCFECHSTKKQKGGLLLTSRESILTGGASGPAIRLGDIEKSMLIEAVRYRNSDFQMPPKQKLADRDIRQLEEWVAMGAPWPDSDARTKLGNKALSKKFEITERDRNYWAFKPLQQPSIPTKHIGSGSYSPIDLFIDQELEKKALSKVPTASRRTLIRRAYFDLIGLPPSYSEILTFEQDPSPNAFERVIERLLANPLYGERYGRHWLDVVRFAQTNGYERDDEKPLAWKYRDYVIQSFNMDKSYRQFVREQIAGDELDQPTHDSLIATGFFRMGVWDDEPDDRRAAEFDGLDDMLKTTSETFLGLTIGCARCHDHMFDPISQKDYYSLLSFLRNIRYYDRPQLTYNSATYIPLSNPESVREWRRELSDLKTKAEKAFEAATRTARRILIDEKSKSLSDETREALNIPTEDRTLQQTELAKNAASQLKPKRNELIEKLSPAVRQKVKDREQAIKQFESSPPWGKEDYALGVKENGSLAPATHLLIRGNAGRPSDAVSPLFPKVLTQHDASLPQIDSQEESSGRRRALADWIASEEHPLTARVFVNRIWQHHFGRGLVATPNDFGKAGIQPSHPELLEWLAHDFVLHGWSTKWLHKRIMMSETYQRASTNDPKSEQIDPGNRFLWRQNLRRLEAEALRDSILHTADNLNHRMGGRGFFPLLSSEVVAGGSRPGRGWDYSPDEERNRRSVYTFIKRTMGVPLLEAFDYNNTEGSIGTRTTTTVAPQALTLLNDEFVNVQASFLASALIKSHGSNTPALINSAFHRVLSKDPSQMEHAVALQFLTEQRREQETLSMQLTFRPAVPNSLERSFLNRLTSERFLSPPNHDWQAYKGRWGNEYEGILVADDERGPFALWKPIAFHDGLIEGLIKVEPAATRSSFLLNAVPHRDSFIGYEILIDHIKKMISVYSQSPTRSLLGAQSFSLPRHSWISFAVNKSENRISVQIEGMAQPLVVTNTATMPPNGHLGIRSRGGATRFDNLALTTNGRTFSLSNVSPHTSTIPIIASLPDLPGWQIGPGNWKLEDQSSIKAASNAESEAFWTGHNLQTGASFQARINLSRSRDRRAGLALKTNQRIIDVSVDAKDNLLVIGEKTDTWKELGRQEIPENANNQYRLSLVHEGNNIQITVNGTNSPTAQLIILNGEDLESIGLKSWRSEAHFDQISTTDGSHATHYQPQFANRGFNHFPSQYRSHQEHSNHEAVSELCSMLFNLNEFIYVD